ncbi:hypothetical protein YIM_23190 [Amycolatopsis sp. YIM 10]|nr:hypothetical protein YIM_23190 [Amycolatopsis sp. YIM 10]
MTAALTRFRQAGDRWGQAGTLPMRARLRRYDDLDGAGRALRAAYAAALANRPQERTSASAASRNFLGEIPNSARNSLLKWLASVIPHWAAMLDNGR